VQTPSRSYTVAQLQQLMVDIGDQQAVSSRSSGSSSSSRCWCANLESFVVLALCSVCGYGCLDMCRFKEADAFWCDSEAAAQSTWGASCCNCITLHVGDPQHSSPLEGAAGCVFSGCLTVPPPAKHVFQLFDMSNSTAAASG
jgi:hypothetical protein